MAFNVLAALATGGLGDSGLEPACGLPYPSPGPRCVAARRKNVRLGSQGGVVRGCGREKGAATSDMNAWGWVLLDVAWNAAGSYRVVAAAGDGQAPR